MFKMATMPAVLSHNTTGCDARILPQADLQPKWDIRLLKSLIERW